MTNDDIRQLELLLRETAELLKDPSVRNRRVAKHNLERVSILAATLAATVRARQ